MLDNKPVKECTKCYEQEASGFFSQRQSANQHFGHNIKKVQETKDDGTFERFEMTYWDIRFSNLCNFSCRSCGIPFSSNWFNDHVKLHGKPDQPKVVYAGKTKTDAMEQLMEHIPYLEQVYFAGGEPLIMEEHYIILNELIKRKMTNVRLIYNTNFSRTAFKDSDAIEMWSHFKDVSVGASLDAMGPRAELMRKGTEWDITERNRERMLEIAPHVDFYISPTLNIFNSYHLPDFHKDWVRKGFIRPADLNVNILQDPMWYRLDLLPQSMKEEITQKYEAHIKWLTPRDPLTRAGNGFRSALTFMNGSDKSKFLPMFNKKVQELDKIREEKTAEVFPELQPILDA
jgi:organic radical activating enzyme